MGNLTNHLANRRRNRGATAGFFQTQPGDPEFSPSQVPGSAQYPAAAAEYRFYENRRNASNRLADAASRGYNIYDPQYEELQQVADEGWIPRALTLGERLVGWIDGPRQAVNLLFQDILGEGAEEGYENPGLLDYWDAMWGGIEDHEEFTRRTGLSPRSGSQTLDMFGWDEEEEFLGRVGRGVVDFGLQVVSDPLTYVTFGLSGLGRGVAKAAGQRLQREAVDSIIPLFKEGLSGMEIAQHMRSPYLRRVARNLEDDIGRLQRDFIDKVDEFDGALPPDMKSAMERYLSRNAEPLQQIPGQKHFAPIATPETFWENIAELAVAKRVGDDVIKPLASRDFGLLHELAPDALQDLPAYAWGGARISVPFTKRSLESGFMIPGTAGLGRKIAGDPARRFSQRMRASGTYAKIADALDSGVDSFDRYRGLWKAVGEKPEKGGIASWQYYIAAPVLDHVHNTGARRIILRQLNSQMENISGIAQEQGIEDLSVIYADIMGKLQQASPANEIVDDMRRSLGIAPETTEAVQQGMKAAGVYSFRLEEAVDNLTNYVAATFEEYHTKLATLDPSVKDKFLDGMIPHVKTGDGHGVLGVFGNKNIGIRQAEIEEDPGMAMLARLLTAQHQGGKLETRLGATRWYNEQIGRVNAFTLTDAGPIMLDGNWLEEFSTNAIQKGVVDRNWLKTRFLPVTQINEMLEPAIRRLADRHDIILPKNWDGKIFNENPLEVLAEYVQSMEEAIAIWQLVDGLKTSGLAFRSQKSLNVQDTVQSIFANIVRHTEDVPVHTWNKPQEGDNLVPMRVIESIVDERDMREGLADVTTDYVTISIDDLGQPRISDGHGVIAKAREEGASALEVRIQFQSDYTITRGAEGIQWDEYVDDAFAPTWETAAPYIDDMASNELVPWSGVGFKAEDHIVIGALGTWMGSGNKLRKIIRTIAENPNKRVPATSNRDTLEAMALMREHLRKAKPWREIVPTDAKQALEFEKEMFGKPSAIRPLNGGDPVTRVSRMRGGAKIERMEVGETLSIHMESAGVGEHPFLRRNDGKPPGQKSWVYLFDPDTPVLPNWNNVSESEVLVSGNFRATAVDDELKTITLAYDGPSLPAIGDLPTLKARDAGAKHYPLSEAFKQLPWAPSPNEDLGILKGFDGLTSRAVPPRVMRPLIDGGLPSTKDTIHQNKELFEMSRMSNDEWSKMRPKSDHVDYTPLQLSDDPPFGRKPKTNSTVEMGFDADGPRSVRATVYPKDLNATRWANGLREGIRRIDSMFSEHGISPENIRRVMQSGDTDDGGAELVREWLKAKMHGQPDAVKEFFTGEAAEVFDARMYYDAWEAEITHFLKEYSFPMTPGGQLVFNPSRLRQVGDSEVLRQLGSIKDAAGKAQDAGYDEIAKIMSGAEVYHKMTKHEWFSDPAKYALGGPAVNDLQIHDDVANYIRKIAGNAALMYTPQGIAAAKLASNNTLRWWRAMATIARPSFHIRNLVGGSWMNMIGGVSQKSNAMVALNAPRFRAALSKAYEPGADILEEALKVLPKDAQPYFRAIWEEDILNGFVSTEFRKLTPAEKASRLSALNVFDADNFFMSRIGGKTMESIEDFLRASMFVEYYDPANPASAKVAREMVNAFHFDYANLTPMETKAKSLIPFFVWTRRNLPRQLQLATENPRTVQRYRAMMQALNDNFGGNDETLPQGDHFSAYAAGTDYYVNPNTPFWARMMIDPDLPIRDFLEMPMPTGPDALDWANGLLGPHISTLFDVNEQREWGDVSAPAQFVPILQGLAAIGLYDKSPTGEVRIPYLLRTIMETAAPMSRELVDPLTGGPTDPNRQQRVGIHPEDNFIEGSLKNLAAIIGGGMGMKATTPADARGTAARSRDELSSIIERMRFAGELPPSER